MTEPKLLAFAGSTRHGSLNKRLVAAAAAAARRAGSEVTLIDLRDYPMPLYDGDLEAEHGLPDNARALKALMISHDGFLIAAPEYNSAISGVLKNTIDWASRAEPGEPALAAFRGKTAGLLSASPGALGGLRTLVSVRTILGNLGALVIPDQQAVPRAHEAFDADGRLIDERIRTGMEHVAQRLVEITGRLHPGV